MSILFFTVALSAICDPERNNVWRLEFAEDGSIRVSLIGLPRMSHVSLPSSYRSLSEAEPWVQERVAVLSLLDPCPKHAYIRGVGRRMSENIFWVVEPSDTYGQDPREQG